MSRLLSRLQGQLDLTAAPHQRAQLSAQIACVLARMGAFEEALKIVSKVRETYSDGRSGRVTVWVMLAEGLILYFDDRALDGLDRIRRALFLAEAMGYADFVAIAAAWKAHIEFNRSDFNSLVGSIRLSVVNLTTDNLDAKARVAVVLCESFIMGGEQTLAQTWFHRAHECAVRNGDQAGIEAAQFNKASCLVARIRVEHCKGQLTSVELARTKREVDSANNLNALVQTSGLLKHVGLLSARLSLLEGDFLTAILQFDKVALDAPLSTHHFDPNYLKLEKCFCSFGLEDRQAVDLFLKDETENRFPQLDVDDQIFSHWMLMQMSARDARFGDLVGHKKELSSALLEYESMHSRLVSSLSEVITSSKAEKFFQL